MCFWIYLYLTWILVFQFCYCKFTQKPARFTDGCTGDNVPLTWGYNATSVETVTWTKDGIISLTVNNTGITTFTKNEIDHVSDGTVKINTDTFLESKYSIIVEYTLSSGKLTITDTVNVAIYEKPDGISCSYSPDDTFTCSSKSLGSPNVELFTFVNGIPMQTTTYQSELYQCQTIECCFNGSASSCITGSYTPGSTTYCITAQEATTYTCWIIYVIIVVVYNSVALLFAVVLLVKQNIGKTKNQETCIPDNQCTCGNGSLFYASLTIAVLCIVIWIVKGIILAMTKVCPLCICGYSCGWIAFITCVVLLFTAAIFDILTCKYMNIGCCAGNTKCYDRTAKVICILLLGMSIMGYIVIFILYCRKRWPFKGILYAINVTPTETANCNGGPEWFVIFHNGNKKSRKVRLPICNTDDKEATQIYNVMVHNNISAVTELEIGHRGNGDREACIYDNILVYSDSTGFVQRFENSPEDTRYLFTETSTQQKSDRDIYVVNITNKSNRNIKDRDVFLVLHPEDSGSDKPVKVWLPRVTYKPGETNECIVPLNRRFAVQDIDVGLRCSASGSDFEIGDVTVRRVKTGDHWNYTFEHFLPHDGKLVLGKFRKKRQQILPQRHRF